MCSSEKSHRTDCSDVVCEKVTDMEVASGTISLLPELKARWNLGSREEGCKMCEVCDFYIVFMTDISTGLESCWCQSWAMLECVYELTDPLAVT